LLYTAVEAECRSVQRAEFESAEFAIVSRGQTLFRTECGIGSGHARLRLGT